MPQKILIVDDEAAIRGALYELLSSEKYQCEMAANGAEALERVRTNPPDLIISDIRMPVMDGVQLLHNARSLDPNLAVILVTAVMDVDTAVRALKNGAFDYITKPFRLQDVLDRVQ